MGIWSIIDRVIDRLTTGRVEFINALFYVTFVQLLLLLLSADRRPAMLAQVLTFLRPWGSFPYRLQAIATPETASLDQTRP